MLDMSDEILNSNEETEALFVSAQKKKKAEEEAKRKAAEEKAKRDAAEAEVRKMEQEVEERKRKAEEERKALEEAEKNKSQEGIKDKIVNSANTAAEKIKVPNAADSTEGKSKSKLPIIIGAVVAVVVIIGIIVAVAGGGSKSSSSIDYATLEYNAQYAVQAEGFNMSLAYPDTVYTNVYEEELEVDDSSVTGISVAFMNEDGSETIKDLLFKFDSMNEIGLTKDGLGFVTAKARLELLCNCCKSVLSGYSYTLSEETYSDIQSETLGNYYYKCNFVSDDEAIKGSATSWLSPNSDGEYIINLTLSYNTAADTERAASALNLFENNNTANALKIPGANPPTSTEIEDMVLIDDMHMGIHIPQDQFCDAYSNSTGAVDGGKFFFDENGAIIMVIYEETDIDFETANSIMDSLLDIYKESADNASNAVFATNLESRMFVGEQSPYNEKPAYYATYKDVMGGLTYWEGYYASHWQDVRTQKYYFYSITMLAPEKNQDIYEEIFTKSLDRLDDI